MGNFTQGILNAHLYHFLFNFLDFGSLTEAYKKKSKNSKKCIEIKILITKNY